MCRSLKISHSFIRGFFKRFVQNSDQDGVLTQPYDDPIEDMDLLVDDVLIELGRGLMERQEVNEVINTS